MCGIAGVLREDGLPAGSREHDATKRMLAALQHRGPDGSGITLQGALALGHARLALTDTSAAGAQPIVAPRYGLVAAINGTIHNAAELRAQVGGAVAAGSDCAVLPPLFAAEGLNAFARLEGPFAAALYATHEQTLTLARDHHGRKPLFYARHEGWFCFASEIAALACVLPALRPDAAAIAATLRFGWCLPPRTLFEGIATLAPGTALQVRPAPRSAAPESPACIVQHAVLPRWRSAPHEESASNLLDHLQRAVDRRYAGLQRPAGVLLSGGLDSAAVLLCAARHGASAYCFAPTTAALDESAAAQTVADACRVRLQVVRSDFAPHEQLLLLTRMTGDAHCDPSTLQLAALCAAAGTDATVLLSGDGGDELLLGYRRHGIARAADGVARCVPAWLWNAAAFLAPRSRDRDGLRALGQGRHAFAALASLAPSQALAQVLCTDAPSTRNGATDPFAAWFPAISREDAAARAGAADLALGLAHGLMTKADRAAMSSGHEIWAPFLDNDVVQYCQALPGTQRRSLLRGKLPLRRELYAHFPASIVAARKRGFAAPLQQWLQRADTYAFAEAMLHAERDAFEGVLQQPAPALLRQRKVRALQPVIWAALSVAVALHTAKEASRALPSL